MVPLTFLWGPVLWPLPGIFSPLLPRPGINRWLSGNSQASWYGMQISCVYVYLCSLWERKSRDVLASQSGSVGCWSSKSKSVLLQASLTFSSLRNILFLINTPWLLTNDFKEIILFLHCLGQIILSSGHKEEKGKSEQVRDNVEEASRWNTKNGSSRWSLLKHSSGESQWRVGSGGQ